MQSLTWQSKGLSIRIAQNSIDQGQIVALVQTVNLVSYDGVTHMLKVDPDLMLAPRQGADFQQGEGISIALKSFENAKGCGSRVAIGADPVFDRYLALGVLAQRSVDFKFIICWPTMNDGTIGFFN